MKNEKLAEKLRGIYGPYVTEKGVGLESLDREILQRETESCLSAMNAITTYLGDISRAAKKAYLPDLPEEYAEGLASYFGAVASAAVLTGIMTERKGYTQEDK